MYIARIYSRKSGICELIKCVSKRNACKSLDQIWCFSICEYFTSTFVGNSIEENEWRQRYCRQRILCIHNKLFNADHFLRRVKKIQTEQKSNLRVYWWLSLVSHTLEISIKNVKHLKYCVFMSILLFVCVYINIYDFCYYCCFCCYWSQLVNTLAWLCTKNSNERLTTVVYMYVWMNMCCLACKHTHTHNHELISQNTLQLRGKAA